MWIAKVKIDGSNALIGKRTIKYGLVVSGYPISSFVKKDGIYIYIVGFLFGKDKDKKSFLRDARKDEKVLHIENKEDFIMAQLKEPIKFKKIYNHKIIHLEPIIINEKGEEYWTVGSWDKQDLMKFIDLFEKTHNGRMLSIIQKKVTNFSLVSLHPKMTAKQKKAMELAIRNGYYDYPRRIDVKGLAKLSGLSFSTYQVHLRKAEHRLIPFFFEKSN